MKLVIFDLDNTLINGQSQQFLLSYAFKKGLIGSGSTFIIMVWFAAYRLSLINDPRHALRFAFDRLLRGRRSIDLRRLLEDFYKDVLEKKINRRAADRLKRHQEQGDRIILLSNSLKPLVDLLAEKFGITERIATVPEEIGGVYTGRIIGRIAYGENKLELARPMLEQTGQAGSVAYADHWSDLPLLLSVSEPVAVNPDKKLARFARENNWEIIASK